MGSPSIFVLFLSVCFCVGLHIDMTHCYILAHLFSLSELHLSWVRLVVERHRKRNHLEAFEIRGSSSSSRIEAGVATAADLMTLQQQI